MNIEELREFCLSVKGATESMPFGDDSLVIKVLDKMFALIPLDIPQLSIALKCDPELAVELRERYISVEPAYHFNKKYWNSISFGRDMNDEEIKKWILHSRDEVLKKLPKKVQDEYYRN
jgi:predicted DNA-binding protein (MmcQ/YjbR family)